MTEVDDGVLRRIKKCLALSKSSNANEAATALRHAQTLMKQHGLSEDDVAGLEIQDETVKTVEGFGRCVFLGELTALMRKAFGVEAIMERNPGSANRANIRYVGPAGRAALAVYAHRVVTRAVDEAWKEHLVHFPWHKTKGGKRTAFRLGWLTSVRAQIEACGFTEQEENAIARWKERKFGNSLVKQKPRTTKMDHDDRRVAYAGAEAGKDFRLHRPMSGSTGSASSAPLRIGVDK